jgi:D-threo-aldose 1-dehydrogenase
MEPTTRVPFGRTGLSVTPLGMGTTTLGNMFAAVEDDTARATVERAYDLGLRLFDTAPVYGMGLAEQRLGPVIAQYPRDEFVLATKVGRLLRADAPMDQGQIRDGKPLFRDTPPVQPVFDFSYDGAMRSVEESLNRLGLDRIDILHIHDPDDYYEEALAGAYVALDKLRSEGVIRAVGVGMNQWQMLARFAREADFDCFLLAGRYTLLEQGALDEFLPLCAEKGIAVVIGGPLNSGILANPQPGATYNYARADEATLARAQRIKAVCDRYDVPIAAAAFQFPLAHPAVATVITGMRAPEEVEENVRLMRHPIPAALWEELRAEGLLHLDAPVPGGDG